MPLVRATLVATTSRALAVAEYDEASGLLELDPAAAPQTAMGHFERYSANGRQAQLG